jgi:hypothetical protein
MAWVLLGWVGSSVSEPPMHQLEARRTTATVDPSHPMSSTTVYAPIAVARDCVLKHGPAVLAAW